MDEYIVREAAIEICEKEYRERLRIADYCGDTVAWNIGAEIKNMPTADVAPVVHGRWRYYSTTMQECSNCQRHTARHKFKYCPHCGAIMEDKYHESTD